MGGAEDSNHPHIFESSCVCPDTYTGAYCTDPVSLTNDQKNHSSFDSNSDASLSTGAVVALIMLVPTTLAIGFLCGAFFANKRARTRSSKTQTGSPLNAMDSEVVFQDNEFEETGDDANNACEVDLKSIEVV